ncbi:Uncharacterised protein [Vibrio cholerae]|uniref:Uncharacterized protein n=1 Tax=Vibrio cholerae TaxID=666 RepID=A0A656AI78_VIBCL|nr:Uncharacterised protein [Vibrio cholerae]CSD11844.1 Uncharacterised protein [Vibrio cholerae]
MTRHGVAVITLHFTVAAFTNHTTANAVATRGIASQYTVAVAVNTNAEMAIITTAIALLNFLAVA